MTQTIPVKNIASRPVDVEGGRVLARGEFADVPDGERLRAQIDAGLLVQAGQLGSDTDIATTTGGAV